EILGKSVIGTLIPKTETGESELELMIHELTENPQDFPVNTNLNTRKDGSQVWVYWTNSPILDSKGKLTEILCQLAVIPKEEIEGADVEEAFPPLGKYAGNITQAIESGIPEAGFRTRGMTDPNSHQDIIIYPLTDDMKGAVIRIDDAT
ncbi:PAS domain S-box protein, partial [Aduncisulcus paluster]